MIATNSVSYAVYLAIASDANLVSSGGLFAAQQPVRVGWQGPIPRDPALAPFIQVHAAKHHAEPYLIGAGTRSWRNRFEIPLFMQTVSIVGSGDAFKQAWDIEHYLAQSVYAISSNFSLPTLTANAAGANLMFDGFASELFEVDQQNEMTLVTILATLKYNGQG